MSVIILRVAQKRKKSAGYQVENRKRGVTYFDIVPKSIFFMTQIRLKIAQLFAYIKKKGIRTKYFFEY